jgi:hypothetical protein
VRRAVRRAARTHRARSTARASRPRAGTRATCAAEAGVGSWPASRRRHTHACVAMSLDPSSHGPGWSRACRTS